MISGSAETHDVRARNHSGTSTPKQKSVNPSKLTPETSKKILDMLRLGNYIETACKAAGIQRDTFYKWLERGRRKGPKDKPYVEFLAQVDEAMAMSEVRDLATIQRASATQWQAAAWRLERRYPDRWGRREQIRVDASVDGLAGFLASAFTAGALTQGEATTATPLLGVGDEYSDDDEDDNQEPG